MRGLFITGTDTGVGKTYITCAIVRELRAARHRVGAYKPVCSGVHWDAEGRAVWGDVAALRQELECDFKFQISNLKSDVTNLESDMSDLESDMSDLESYISPQRFIAALAPPIAARQEGRFVDVAELQRGLEWWRSRCDIVVVEGAGGLLCPLTDDQTMADLAARFQFPLLIVARWGLGTINHTLLTIEAARSRGLSIAGVVLNETQPTQSDDSSTATNADEIVSRSGVPVLGIRRYGAAGWISRVGEPLRLDWWAFAGEASRS